MSRNITFILGFLLFSTFVQAQGQVTFEAATDAREVVEGNVFELYFTLKNANGQDFRPPSFDDFKVVGGPNRSISNSIINGRMSSEMTISYTLLAQKRGKITIRPATIKAGNKQLSTRPLQVSVVKAKKPKQSTVQGASGDEAVFLTVELSDSVAYVGQQVLVDYKIYTTVNVESYNLVSESDYGGVLNQEIRRFNKQPVRVAIDGVQYVTQVLKRVAIFPQQAGDLTIDEFLVRVGMPDKYDNRRRSFFFKKLKFQTIAANSTVLKVRSLPKNAPEDFCGAVGEYTMTASVSPSNLTTDDALSVKYYLRGNGDPKQVLLGKTNFPDGFDVYDPKLLREDIKEQGGELHHVKEIEQLALPEAPHNFTMQPTVSYFNPDSAKYIRLSAQAVPITIRQGTNKARVRKNDRADSKTEVEMSPIMTETNLKTVGSRFFLSPIFWLLFLLPIIIFGYFFYKKRKENNAEEIDPLEQKRKRARKVAEQRLAKAKQHLDAGAPKQFYDEISDAAFGYIGDKFHISLSQLNKSNVEEKLKVAGVDAALIERFMQILKTCEMALFAGKDNAESMSEIYGLTGTVLEELEEHF